MSQFTEFSIVNYRIEYESLIPCLIVHPTE
jgi:hypothetical protein